LFYTACGVWVAAWILLFLRRAELRDLAARLRAFFTPSPER
jgi:hypothetical protein